MSATLPTAPVNPPPLAGVPAAPIYRLSVRQYHAMAEHGILANAPVELIHGWLVQKRTKNSPHALANGLVQDALTALRLAGWHVRAQEPITTDESEPEPDCVLALGARRDYQDRHPGPAEVALVVEVADTRRSSTTARSRSPSMPPPASRFTGS
jgi:hypothetical protein